MPKPFVPMSKRHPLGPRVKVHVTAELINSSVRAHSSHCMIAEAIKAAYPEARQVSVDISTCRFSDPTKGLRYVYLTPRTAQECLVDFDEGLTPQPFAFLLRGAHVSKAGNYAKRQAERNHGKGSTAASLRRATLKERKKGAGKVPDRVGGKRPPQLHIRREFGLRAFRAASLNRLKAEQPIEGGNSDDQ